MPGLLSRLCFMSDMIVKGVRMRQIISIDGRSDLWFYKENRIEILVNNRYSDSVDFYLVEDYKGKYWETPKNIEYMIAMDEDVSAYFLEGQFLEPYFSRQYNIERISSNAGFEHWGYNFYSKEQVDQIITDIESLILLLVNDHTNPLLKSKLNPNMAYYCKNEKSGHGQIVRQMDDEERFNYIIANRAVVIDFYRRFIEHLKIMFMASPLEKKYLLVLGP